MVQELQDRPPNLLQFMPGAFVLLWSTGFIVAKFGLPFAPPFTFLSLRFLCVLAVLLPLVALVRAPWPPAGQARHIALAGILLHAGYLGGVWSAIKLGMPAGISALIVGMQPLLTAFSAPLIGEAVTRRQWLGLVLGFCGVALVVSNKLNGQGMDAVSLLFCVGGLLSITMGTLYQKRHCPQFDLRTGTVIQFGASLAVLLPLSFLFEGLDWRFSTVHWNATFIAALSWSVLAMSIGAIFLLFALIRRSAATAVSSLMYLTPPTTAVMAWLCFGEALGVAGIAGMALALVGVMFVVKKSEPPPPIEV
ncbi:MAG TPA: DMT family transporter [Burkholderiaceae bacterium]